MMLLLTQIPAVATATFHANTTVAGEPYLPEGSADPFELHFTTRSPFMHAGWFRKLGDVVDHSSSAPLADLGHKELKSLELTKGERQVH